MSKKNKTSGDIPYDVFTTSRTVITCLTIICVVLTLTSIGLGLVSAKLYSAKEKVPTPIFYEVKEESKHIVRIEQGVMAEDKQSLLRSKTFRDYVFNRETVNHIDDVARWGEVKVLSSRWVWDEFTKLVDPNVNKNSPLKNLDFEREIEIVTDYPLKGSSDVYRVEFIIKDSVGGKSLLPQRHVAVIEYDASKAFVSYSDRYVNIDGITIVNYQIYRA